MRRSAPPSSRWVAALCRSAVRADVRCPVDGGDRLVHDRAGLALIEAAAAGAEQQRRARLRGGQCRTPVGQPCRQRELGGLTERHGALLVALAQHPQQPPGRVDVVDVQAAQLADPDAGGVQQLDDEPVPQCEWITLLRTGIGGGHGVQRLILTQHGGQCSTRLGDLQPGGRIARQQSPARRPGGEGLHRRGAPRQRGPGGTCRGLGRKPRPQNRQCQLGDRGVGCPLRHEVEQRTQVAEVCTPGVFGAAALQRQVVGELVEDRVHSPTVADGGAVTQPTRRIASGVRSFSVG